jgi:hypothetical protein
METARRSDKGHGRREVRTIWVTNQLNGYLQWEGVQRVFRLVRWRFEKGEWSLEVVYGITSLTVSAKTLLERIRRHWSIENQLHWVRDQTLGEDRCRVRTHAAPQVLAILRNVALGLLAGLKFPSLPTAIRHLAIHIEKAIRLVSTPR